MATLRSLEKKWQGAENCLSRISFTSAARILKDLFCRRSRAKQSVINIGCLGLSRNDKDYYAATVMNQKLGGSFNGT